jgi:hypothetical protein
LVFDLACFVEQALGGGAQPAHPLFQYLDDIFGVLIHGAPPLPESNIGAKCAPPERQACQVLPLAVPPAPAFQPPVSWFSLLGINLALKILCTTKKLGRLFSKASGLGNQT